MGDLLELDFDLESVIRNKIGHNSFLFCQVDESGQFHTYISENLNALELSFLIKILNMRLNSLIESY